MRLALALVLLVACDPKEPVALGTSCSTTGKQACAVGKLAQCTGGKWQESMTCPGPKGCYLFKGGHGSTSPLCDDGLARAGNPCGDARDVYCAEDRRSKLACKNGRWQIAETCAQGCSYDPNGISCR
jgi:hypothetical protein